MIFIRHIAYVLPISAPATQMSKTRNLFRQC